MFRRPICPPPDLEPQEVGDKARARRIQWARRKSARMGKLRAGAEAGAWRGKSAANLEPIQELGDKAMAGRSARRGKSGGRHQPKTGGRHSKVIGVGDGRGAPRRGLGPGDGRAKTTGAGQAKTTGSLAVGDFARRRVSEMPNVEE